MVQDAERAIMLEAEVGCEVYRRSRRVKVDSIVIVEVVIPRARSWMGFGENKAGPCKKRPKEGTAHYR